MNPSASRRIRTVVAALLILGPIVCLGFVTLFAWGWTDSTNWGTWSKGPQTLSEHLQKFFSFMLRSYWPQILVSAAMIVTGAYLWPRRLSETLPTRESSNPNVPPSPPSAMKDTRLLWIDEQQSGPFSVDQLYRMAKREEIGPHTLFWSDSRQKWLPLTGVLFDIEPGEFEQMQESGILRVEILDSGTGEDCPECHALTGRTYPITSVPELPPEGCTCVPWCRCTVIAAPDED